ncbi:unnamed protein product [Tuber aestivum]|uniref:Uncharacterized protein n=1 Tax=Tuber aestivum TaxID=59557 RepID=A0A292PNG1_9PEZI|nr:unnamed protein product [Tuber aestivum]
MRKNRIKSTQDNKQKEGVRTHFETFDETVNRRCKVDWRENCVYEEVYNRHIQGRTKTFRASAEVLKVRVADGDGEEGGREKRMKRSGIVCGIKEAGKQSPLRTGNKGDCMPEEEPRGYQAATHEINSESILQYKDPGRDLPISIPGYAARLIPEIWESTGNDSAKDPVPG